MLLLLSLLPALGCDKATPVAPNGTVLTISANPSKVSLNGRSTITVVGRKPDGNPLNPGTEIRLSTDKGTVDSIVTTDDGGRATATFRADGRAGAAKITAMTGGNVMVTTDVQVGEVATDKPTVIITVNPSTIPTGGSATVTVVGRNSDGSSAAGQQVILTSTLGTLGNNNDTSVRVTLRGDGTASTSLRAGPQAGTAKVTAILGTSDAATADVEIKDAVLTITANRSSVPEQATTMITITATVTAFQGTPLSGKRVDFRSERGTLSATSVTTNSDGQASVTLTVMAPEVSAPQTFQVTATTPSGSGDPLTASLNITIENNIL